MARNVAGFLAFFPAGCHAFFGSLGGGVAGGQTDDRNGSVNGGRSDQGNITLDGGTSTRKTTRGLHQRAARHPGFGGGVPQHDHEWRRRTGRGSGADIALVTKSGTNDLHGTLYEYRRGTETAANDFFSNPSGVPVAPLKINIFGGAVGGPIKEQGVLLPQLRRAPRRQFHQRHPHRAHRTLKQGIV